MPIKKKKVWMSILTLSTSPKPTSPWRMQHKVMFRLLLVSASVGIHVKCNGKIHMNSTASASMALDTPQTAATNSASSSPIGIANHETTSSPNISPPSLPSYSAPSPPPQEPDSDSDSDSDSNSESAFIDDDGMRPGPSSSLPTGHRMYPNPNRTKRGKKRRRTRKPKVTNATQDE